ncbi:MAG: hypothetical protein M3362_25020 [Acidobacteriota bacterium]|nr:hypothetical protein [Acidobacteriota bacterium]
MAGKKGKPRATKSSPTEEEVAATMKEPIVRADLWILKSESILISDILKRFFKGDRPLHKSEVLRAGIYALHKLPDGQVQEIVNSLVSLKKR